MNIVDLRKSRPRTKFGVGDDQRLLHLALFDDLIREELLETLAEFAFLDGSYLLNGSHSRSEAVKRLELQAMGECSRERAVAQLYSLLTICSPSLVSQNPPTNPR